MSAPAPERPRPEEQRPEEQRPKTRRTASLTEWLWPFAAVLLLAGVAAAALGIVGHPLAVVVLPAMTAIAALMADHYVD